MPTLTETTDAAANTSTQYTVGIGQTIGGSLGTVGDDDWYRVELTAGHTYSISMVGTGLPGTNVVDTWLDLYNSAGSLLTSDDDGGPGAYSTLTFTCTTTGTYYIAANSYSLAEIGTYEVSVTEGSLPNYDLDMGAGVLDRWGVTWSTPGTPATVTWGARTSDPNTTDNVGDPAPFSQLTAAQVAAVQVALSRYSDVANITFTQVNPGGTTNDADILFSNYYSTTDGSGAYTSDSAVGNTIQNSDVRLNTDSVSTTSLPIGSYDFQTLMHEIGHAVGLAHPGDYNAAPGVDITYNDFAQFIQDSQQFSVMSYFDESNTGADFNGYPDTLMMGDIYTLQLLYGANMTTRAGDTVYGFNSNAGDVFDFSVNANPAFCIWDAGGNDTIDASGYAQNETISLLAASFSSIGGLTDNVSIAYGATIENAIGGSGNDTITGNAVNNHLVGGGGNDVIDGGAGNDLIDGGSGTNTVDGGSGRDVATFNFTSSQASMVHNGDGSWTIGYGGTSTTLTNVEIARFTNGDVALRQAPTNDFDASNTSDILWRNSTGAVGTWLVGDSGVTWRTLGGISTTWTLAGVGDFNADGTSDILWRQNSGLIGSWLLGSDGSLAWRTLGGISTNWEFGGTGDFNADGVSDVLWRQNSGLVGSWLVNSGGGVTWRTLGGINTSKWNYSGVGDFNGDGTSDILWKDSSGLVGTWLTDKNGGVSWRMTCSPDCPRL